MAGKNSRRKFKLFNIKLFSGLNKGYISQPPADIVQQSTSQFLFSSQFWTENIANALFGLVIAEFSQKFKPRLRKSKKLKFSKRRQPSQIRINSKKKN